MRGPSWKRRFESPSVHTQILDLIPPADHPGTHHESHSAGFEA
jgi:hypothetical protein